MHMPFRLPYLAAALLLGAAPFAGAESPMPDPIAPAVIGRPLDQIRPVRPHHAKVATAKPARQQQVAHERRPATVALGAGPAQQPVPASQQVASVAPAPAAQAAPAMEMSRQLASRPGGPGYFNSKDQVLVRMYYDSHPASAQATSWRIGESIPAKAELTGVPDGLRAALSALPRGHQYEYVQLDGEVVLVAVQSRTVVDGISRAAR